MGYNLSIEIEAENHDKVNSLLQHIYKEIIEGPDYKDMMIESSAKSENGWLVIDSDTSKGRYRWKKLKEMVTNK